MTVNGFLLFYQVALAFFALMFVLDIALIGVSPATYAWPVCFAYYYMRYQEAKQFYNLSKEKEDD